jgi:hypothetical protein
MSQGEPPVGTRGSPRRWSYGLLAVLIGVAALLIAFIAVLVVTEGFSSETIAALGVIASPIVAIVSAYFGIKATQGAAEATVEASRRVGEAEKEAMDAERRVEQQQVRVDLAQARAKTQTKRALRGAALAGLEKLAAADPETDTHQQEREAAFVWDEILAQAGMLDDETDLPDP